MLREIGLPIGTCSYLGGVPSHTYWQRDWTDLVAFNSETFGPGAVYHTSTPITYHAEARNELARKFVGDWLIQLDTDHTFECDLVQRLLRSANEGRCDVLCGFYQRKVWPFLPQIYQWIDNGDIGRPVARPIVKLTGGHKRYQIGVAGAGCLFVRRRVFDRIRTELEQQPFDPLPVTVELDEKTKQARCKGSWSEDMAFFLRLRLLGIAAWVDPRIQYTHLRDATVTLDDFDQAACPIGAGQGLGVC